MSPPHPSVLNPQTAAEHRSRLLEVALALTGSRHLAEDLTQETYARVLSKPRPLREGAVFPCAELDPENPSLRTDHGPEQKVIAREVYAAVDGPACSSPASWPRPA